MINSDWYKARLKHKQQSDIKFCKFQIEYSTNFKNESTNAGLAEEMEIDKKIEKLTERLRYMESDRYIDDLTGTIGLDPLFKK